MAILTKIDKTTVLGGKWICGESKLHDGICEPAREVLRVSGSRVYFRSKDGSEAHRLMRTIRFVCDTQEEGDKLYQLGWSQYRELNSVRAKYEEQLKALVAA